jgi:hypothetical protein
MISGKTYPSTQARERERTAFSVYLLSQFVLLTHYVYIFIFQVLDSYHKYVKPAQTSPRDAVMSRL